MAPGKTSNRRTNGKPQSQFLLLDGSGETGSGRPTRLPEPVNQHKEQDCERAIFLSCGIGRRYVDAAQLAARSNATTIEKELIAEGLIDPEVYYRWLATELGLTYVEHIDPDQVVRPASANILLRRDGPLKLSHSTNQVTVIVPEARRLAAEKSRVNMRPQLRRQLIVASPATIRRAVWQAGEQHRVQATTFGLDQERRESSARQVLTGAQGFVLGMVLCLGAAAFVIWPFTALAVLHVVMTLFFSSWVLLRLCSLAKAIVRKSPIPYRRRDEFMVKGKGPLPVYTLLIALYDEAPIVPALVARIAALDWPKSRLDVKYICEADDHFTIAALEVQKLGAEIEIVRVPAFGPRTKPKALQYALQGARGSLVAVYDAED